MDLKTHKSSLHANVVKYFKMSYTCESLIEIRNFCMSARQYCRREGIIQAVRISQVVRLCGSQYMRRASRPINQHQEPRQSSRWANPACISPESVSPCTPKKQSIPAGCASRNAVLALRNGKAERAKTSPSVTLVGLMRMSMCALIFFRRTAVAKPFAPADKLLVILKRDFHLLSICSAARAHLHTCT